MRRGLISAFLWLLSTALLTATVHDGLAKYANNKCDRIWENPLYEIFSEN